MSKKKNYDEYESNKVTNILCFKCKKRFGIDCPGRKPNESTLCQQCFKKTMAIYEKEDIEHRKKYLKQEKNKKLK